MSNIIRLRNLVRNGEMGDTFYMKNGHIKAFGFLDDTCQLLKGDHLYLYK